MAEPNKFGYYTVGNFKSFSKLEAVEQHGRTREPICWNFNQETFSKFNWLQEPPGSLDYWYGVRAQQIRDKYDYIVLFYSGGADSHNILASFVRNNIFIDEIAQYHNLDAEGGNKKAWLNEEVVETSVPITQELIANNPVYSNTQHRLIDLSEIQKQILLKDDNKWDHWYKMNSWFTPNNAAITHIRDYIPAYKNLADQGRKVCFVWAVDKPDVFCEDDKFFVSFCDGMDFSVSPRNQMMNRDWEHDEFFYWSPDLPELVSKQAHVVKRYLEGITPADVDGIHVLGHDIVHDEYGTNVGQYISRGKIVKDGRTYHLLPDGVHRLIYPYWNTDWIVCGKAKSILYSPRDFWFFKNSAPDMGQKSYGLGIVWLREQVRKNAPHMWWEFKYNPKLGPYNGGMRKMKNTYCIGPRLPTV